MPKLSFGTCCRLARCDRISNLIRKDYALSHLKYNSAIPISLYFGFFSYIQKKNFKVLRNEARLTVPFKERLALSRTYSSDEKALEFNPMRKATFYFYFKLALRFLKICYKLCSMAIRLYLSDKLGSLGDKRSVFKDGGKFFSEYQWTIIRDTLVELGPSFIKLGQYIATRPDLFGPEVISQLGRLHDDVKIPGESSSLSSNELRRIQDEFFRSFSIKLSDICIVDDLIYGPERIGAGCIAQVIRLYLRHDERQLGTFSKSNSSRLSSVVLKVKRPNVDEFIHLDLVLMKDLSAFVTGISRLCLMKYCLVVKILPGSIISAMKGWVTMDTDGQIRQFSEMMYKQLNFYNEAFGLLKFRQNFHNRPSAYMIASLKNADGSRDKLLTDDELYHVVCSMNKFNHSRFIAQTFWCYSEPACKFEDRFRLLLPWNWIYHKRADNKLKSTKIQFPLPLLVSDSILMESYMEAIPIKHFQNALANNNLLQRSLEQEISKDNSVHHKTTTRNQRLWASDHLETIRSINEQIADLGLLSFLKMMIQDNFIHSDMHPGNIMVILQNEKGDSYPLSTKKNKFNRHIPSGYDSDSILHMFLQKKLWSFVDDAICSGYDRPVLVFVDTGLTWTLSSQNLDNFLDLFKCVINGNGKKAARLMVERAPLDQLESHLLLMQGFKPTGSTSWLLENDRTKLVPGYREFEQNMDKLISSVHHKTLRLGEISPSDVLKQALSLVQSTQIPLSPYFTNLIVSLIIVEGLGRQLNPEVDLLESARPFLLKQTGSQLEKQVMPFEVPNDKSNGYPSSVWMKLGAFLEARFWVKLKSWDNEKNQILDTLMFMNH